MVVDVNLYQDMEEIAAVDAAQVVDLYLILVLAEITAAYGLLFFSSSAEDAVEILLAVTAVEVTTAAYGLSFFSSSAEDVAEILLAVTAVATMDADATIAAANKRNFEDGFRPSFLHAFIFFLIDVINCSTFSYKFTTIL